MNTNRSELLRSFLPLPQVYNEQLYDLLEEQPAGSLAHRPSLKLKEDSMGRVFVAGLSEVQVGTAGEALALLRRGSRQRQRAETGLNYSSSRSHSIFTVSGGVGGWLGP